MFLKVDYSNVTRLENNSLNSFTLSLARIESHVPGFSLQANKLETARGWAAVVYQALLKPVGRESLN